MQMTKEFLWANAGRLIPLMVWIGVESSQSIEVSTSPAHPEAPMPAMITWSIGSRMITSVPNVKASLT